MAADRTDRVIIHYHRPDRDDAGWNLWVWNSLSQGHGREVAARGHDDFGLVFEIDPAAWDGGSPKLDPIGFLPRRNHWEDRDGPERYWRPGGAAELWVMSRRPGWFPARPDVSPVVVGGFIDQPDEIVVELYQPVDPANLISLGFTIEGPGVPSGLAVAGATPAAGESWIGSRVFRVRLTLTPPIDLNAGPIGPLWVGATGVRPGRVWPRHILDRPEFHSELPLGAISGTDVTTCRVFAPTAASLRLNLYDRPRGGEPTVVSMTREAGGTWAAHLAGDRTGTWYTLTADGPDHRFRPGLELIDPYARAVSSHHGRGRIVRPSAPPAPGPRFGIGEAVVYELHVRDFTIAPESGVLARGLYLGLAEPGTHLPGNPLVTTGLDHLLELGVNTLQLMPVQDFENDEAAGEHHWGYMPVHFNVPDGAYASATDGDERIDELKRTIGALHERGFKVILDVVYNHTAELPPEKLFSFEGLAPGYYYRLLPDGTLSNGSGTGNEFRSEAPMGRRFLIDSLRLWVTEYGVDGFRFDLMGLIDLVTMKAVTRELRAIRPDLFLWGEPWTGGPTPIAPTVKGMQRGQGFAVFNDHFRNAMKGDSSSGRDSFLATGGHGGAFRRGLEGSVNDFTDTPLESVNYVECHDNQTLHDRLAAMAADAGLDGAGRLRLHRLAGAAILLARGIPFLHSGQEFARTKGGADNSYNLGERVNQVDWKLKRRNRELFLWHRDLIRLRRAHPLLRATPAAVAPRTLHWLDDDLHLPVPAPVVAARLERGDTDDAWSAALLLFNPGAENRPVPIPDGEWRLVIDGETVQDGPLAERPLVRRTVSVPSRCVILLARG